MAPTRQELRRAASSPFNRAFGQTAVATNLQNFGGPVMNNVVIYDVYWNPSGYTGQNQTMLDQFAGDLSGPFVNMLTEYGVNDQLNYGGSWVDTKALPSLPTYSGRPVLQDSDVQGIVTDAQNANPGWNAPGLSTLYVVYLPEGTELCKSGTGCTYSPSSSGNTQFCAYHGSFTYATDPNQTPNVYAAMPWDGDRMPACDTGTQTPGYNGSNGPNGDPATDSEISTASHEIFEALTDPEVGTNTAWSGGDNPIDPTYDRPGEIGDLCAYIYNPTAADGGDVTLNGNRYFIQYEWDNLTRSCILPDSAIPANSLSPGCTDNTLPANDDGSTGAVQLPFTLDYFGTTYSTAYVNNNGNVTFAQPQSTFTPYPLSSTNTAIIAPFFADVDTRGTSPVTSGLVTYGTTTYGGNQAFCVLWRNVGYYGMHTDKVNSFELLLVQRPDTGPGDFDIVFNYDKIEWETGDASGGSGGLGGSAARAGFSNGDPTTSVELYGSGVPGEYVDWGWNSLAAGSSSSAQPGRYIYPVRNGNNAGTSMINGAVTDTASPANPQSGALVEACDYTTGTTCGMATTSATGNYSIGNLPAGSYQVTVSPPSGSSLNEQTQSVTLGPSGDVQTANFALTGPTPPPAGTTVQGVGTTGNGIPVLQWQQQTPLTTTGCANGTGTYSISAQNNQTGANQTITGNLPESPVGSGQYSTAIPALYPLHGAGTVEMTITCPNPAQNSDTTFSIYIDPSGTVVDTQGNPIAGATVTLLSADDPNGPFTPVPNGSAVMSPANRTNPDTSRSDGSFGWDVVSGYYKVEAQKAGCTDPSDPTKDYVDSAVLTIPPAVTNMQLVLDCRPTTQIPTPAAVSGDYGDATPVSATLQDANGNGLAGKSLTFTLNGAETCTATTDNSGTATCGVTPGETPGSYTLAVSFAGDSGDGPSSSTGQFTVTAEQTSLQYGGPSTVTNGSPATLSATLLEDGTTPLSGRTVSLTLGSGAGAQTCSAATNASGVVSCTIGTVSQTGATVPVTASFAGDTHYLSASQAASLTLVTPAPHNGGGGTPPPTGGGTPPPSSGGSTPPPSTGATNPPPSTGSTPPPTHTPSQPSPGTLKVTGPAKLKGSTLSVSISCSGLAGATCAGRLSLTESVKTRVARQVHGHRKLVTVTKLVKLGSVAYRLAAGHSAVLTLKLSGAAATLLRQAAKRHTKIAASVLPTGQREARASALAVQLVPARRHARDRAAAARRRPS